MGGRYATSLVVGDEDGVRNPRHRTQQGEEMLRVDGRLFFISSLIRHHHHHRHHRLCSSLKVDPIQPAINLGVS